jgi:maltooligosyltrehalose trehalohydrolase
MTRFSVWAPAATTVALVAGSCRVALDAGEDQGWYSAEVDDLGPGTDYAFSLDGGEPLPDPRSPWQPAGVHGPSRVVDHGSFTWTDHEWHGGGPLAPQVFYELHVGTFTPEGTFAAAADRLTYLRDLGVTAVEIMPVVEFPGARGWGYDGVDLYAPHHAYGGPDGLKALVDRCHATGLGVVLDVVYNHVGPEGNYLPCFGPYFTDRHPTPWGSGFNYDGPDSGPVRAFVIDNALMWLRDFHVDGLRLDAAHAIVDTSRVHLLTELAARVRALADELDRELWVIAESDPIAPRLIQPRAAGGYGLDAVWNDDFHHAVHALLTGERDGYYEGFGAIADLAGAYERASSYAGRQFVAFSQNHDQVGNRATGDRSSHLLATAELKIAAALVLAAPFLPLLFQGEEWGASTPFLYFTDHPDDLGGAVRAGRHAEFAAFGWDPDQIADPQATWTYAASTLDWDELHTGSHRELLDWYRRLIAWRRTAGPVGRAPSAVRTRYSEADRWLVVDLGEVALAVNLAEQAQDLPLPALPDPCLALASDAGARLAPPAVSLPPRSVAIINQRGGGEPSQRSPATLGPGGGTRGLLPGTARGKRRGGTFP